MRTQTHLDPWRGCATHRVEITNYVGYKVRTHFYSSFKMIFQEASFKFNCLNLQEAKESVFENWSILQECLRRRLRKLGESLMFRRTCDALIGDQWTLHNILCLHLPLFLLSLDFLEDTIYYFWDVKMISILLLESIKIS